MSLFVLKDGYRITKTSTGGRVVHVATGQTLDLTTFEVQLLARATASGIDEKDPALREAFTNLTNLGLLVRSGGLQKAVGVIELGPSAPEPAATPAAETVAQAPVPRFRADLDIVRRGNTNLYDITDAQTGRVHAVYDFELSLARMLDGKRTRTELVEAGVRLGIPVTTESLEQFIKHLTANGLMQAPGSGDGRGGPWKARRAWDPVTRQHFQNGLRLSREGRYGQAIRAFELVLTRDAENVEAIEALDEARRNLAANPVAPEPSPPHPPAPAPVLAAPVPSPRRGPAPVAQPAVAAPVPSPQRPAPAAAAAAPPPAKPVEPQRPALSFVFSDPTEERPATAPPAPGTPAPIASRSTFAFTDPLLIPAAAPEAKRAVSVPVFAASVLAALGLGWLGGSLTSSGEGDAPPAPAVAAAVTAPVAAAPVEVVPSSTPDAAVEVEAQADSGVAAAPELPALVPALEVDAGVAPVEVAVVEAAKPDAGTALLEAPPTSVAALAPQAPEAAALTPARILKRGRVTLGTLEATQAGALSWSAAKASAVRRGGVVGQLGGVALTAPKTGLFMPVVESGAKVDQGALLANVVYVEGFIQAFVALPTAPAQWRCEVSDGAAAQRASCVVVDATPKRNGLQLTVTAEPLWVDTSTALELKVGEAK